MLLNQLPKVTSKALRAMKPGQVLVFTQDPHANRLVACHSSRMRGYQFSTQVVLLISQTHDTAKACIVKRIDPTTPPDFRATVNV